jgi:hypothetical protein
LKSPAVLITSTTLLKSNNHTPNYTPNHRHTAQQNESLLLRQPPRKPTSSYVAAFKPILTSSQGDQRAPHDSGRTIPAKDLSALGVLYYHVPSLDDVNALASQRGYKNRDEITVSPEKMGDIYEAKVKSFFDEHLHEDEEIRYIRDGAGYFDVRGKGDEWIRVRLEKVSGPSRRCVW